LPRLLAGGALLAVVLRVLGEAPSPAPARTVAASGLAGATALDRPPSDDDLLYRTAAAAVSVDDPVVRGRLLRLAQYLELGGTAEGDHAEPDDELIAAARDVGLAGEDLVLRRYLAELARLALARPTTADLPAEDELRAWVAARPERFTAAAHVRAHHVYLSGTRRGARLANDAAALLADLRARGVVPGTAATLGDPFVRGPVIDGAHDAVARAYGDELARALDALPAGSWHGPLASPFGLHLVWIEARMPARPASFDEVRGRALHAYLRERGAVRAKRRLAALRCRAHGTDGCAG
jgi:hypothetical protein